MHVACDYISSVFEQNVCIMRGLVFNTKNNELIFKFVCMAMLFYVMLDFKLYEKKIRQI